MKVILTEEQLKCVIQEEINEANLMESLFGLDTGSIIKRIVIALLAGTIAFPAVPRILNNISRQNPEIENVDQNGLLAKIKQIFQNVKNKETQVTNKMKEDPNFQEKVAAIKEYMTMAAKNQNYNPDSIQISPEKMVEACNQTGFDLPLLIAQAHLESCFGLTPRARRTNSVFSVGSYDNGKDMAKYTTQDDSILPYIDLMKNHYLTGKTIDDILKPGGFVNTQNKRYASDKSYENKVRSIRNKIVSKYPILGS